ncbi:MAG TPA: amidohydrolase family protein [Bacteroidota bacterium]|nr:amidohydrolase family protein [Bacteroidota bacterium]
MKHIAALVLLMLCLSPGPAAGQRRYVLKGATLINGVFDRPLKDHLVVVDGSRIIGVGRAKKVIIPADAVVIDLTGKFIIPGLIDAHVHEESMADWAAYLDWGITSVNCMYENTDTALARERWSASDSLRSPRIYATAPIFTVRGGWWEGEGFPDDPTVDRYPEKEADAREAVGKTYKKGIRRIKLMVDDMRWCRDPLPPLAPMDSAIMNALLAEASRLGMTSEVHAPERSMAARAIAGGASALLHGVLDDWLAAGDIEKLLSEDMFYVPTFCLYYFLADVDSFTAHVMADPRFRRYLPPETVSRLTGKKYSERYRSRYPNTGFVASHLPALNGNTLAIASNYGQIAMGTDMWALPGIGAHLELEYMVRAGLTPMQALTAATFLGAKFLGVLDHTGTVEPGKDADLLVLDADPLADITNTRSIDMVIRQGKIYRPHRTGENPDR